MKIYTADPERCYSSAQDAMVPGWVVHRTEEKAEQIAAILNLDSRNEIR